MKILLAVDGSKNSLNAVKSLIEHAGWYKERPQVELIYVHLPVPKVGGLSKSQVERYYQEEGGACLAEAKKRLDAARIGCKATTLVGPVAETLVKHAHDARCDLIFIGTRGRTEAGAALLGSTASKVLHISDIPVLLVK